MFNKWHQQACSAADSLPFAQHEVKNGDTLLKHIAVKKTQAAPALYEIRLY
jgi:hypothetical protein